MHTTSLAHKPYKPKAYNKPAFGHHQIQDVKPFGKAPKYPTTISQARKGVTPLSQRIAGIEPSGYSAGSSSYYADYSARDVDMHYAGARTPPVANGSDTSSNSVVDVTQQALAQLSQSSAFQSLMQIGSTTPVSLRHSPCYCCTSNPVFGLLQTAVKMEPAPPPDLSSLPPRPTTIPSAQPQFSNLQALLEKAGVKSSSAHAFLSAQNNGLPPKPSSYVSGAYSAPAPSAPVTPAAAAPLPSNSLGTQLSMPSATSSFTSSASLSGVHSSRTTGNNGSGSRPHSTTPSAPPRGHGVHAATRELWDVRRQMSALQAQESDLESELRRAGHPVPPKEGNNSYASEQRIRALEDEIAGA